MIGPIDEEHGCWVLPSGRIELGETPEEAAHRELLEESGARVAHLEVLCYAHCFLYRREYWGITFVGEVKSIDSFTDTDEIIEVAFWSGLPDPISSRVRGQIEALHRAAVGQLGLGGK